MAIENQAFTARDLQTGVIVYNKTADAATAGEWKFLVVLGDGTGSGDDPDQDAGTISVRLTINGQVAEGGLVNISKEAFGSDTPIRLTLTSDLIANGEAITIYVKTAHASDGAVKVAVYPRVQAANLIQWLGTAPLGLSSQRVQVDVQAIEGLASAATVLGLWLAEGVQTVADSGTTTTLVDAVLTQADGYWNGALLIFRTGTNVGRTAIITDFDAATDTLTFAPAVPDAVTTEGYVLIPGLGHADIVALGPEASQDVAREAHGVSGTVWHVATDGNDSNDGLSWQTPKGTGGNPKATIEAASANDLILLGFGDFASGSNIAMVAGTAIRGQGKASTKLTFSVGSYFLNDNNSLADLSIVAEDTISFGVSATAKTDIEIRNCYLSGVFDGAVLTSCTNVRIYDSILESPFDAINLSGSIDYHLENCVFRSSGTEFNAHALIESSSGNGVGINCQFFGVRSDLAAFLQGTVTVDGILSLIGSSIHARLTNTDSVATVIGVEAETGANLRLLECNVDVSTAGSGTVVSLKSNTGDLTAVGCQYDRTKTSGTITDVGRIITGTDGHAWADVKKVKTVDADTALSARVDASQTGLDLADGGRLDLIFDDIPTTAEFEARTLVAASYFDSSTDEVTPTGASKTGYALSTAGVAAIWAALTSGLTTVGSIGKWILDKLNVTVSSRLSTAGYRGAGSIELPVVCQVGGTPIDGVAVYLYTDEDLTSLAHGPLYTNAFGKVTFYVDSSDNYYCVRNKASVNFPNPVTFVWNAETEEYEEEA